MVSFIPAGRLGNFFFEFATAFAYAKKHGLKFSVPKQTTHPFWSPIYLHHLQHPDYNSNIPGVRIIEKSFHFDELPFEESWRGQNITLQGYFQSWKYFNWCYDDLVSAINLPYRPQRNVCAIHGRFGDYLTIAGKHILMNSAYLIKAMNLITGATGIETFKVFSDDIPHFKSHFESLYDFEYSTSNDVVDDLIEMSASHSFINSSSTFSWWGAYLGRSKNKMVITPELWFMPGWDNADTKDVIPTNWFKI